MFVIIFVSTGVLCGVFLQVNGQCTTPGCKGSSGGTDEMNEKSQRDYGHEMYQRLLAKIEENDKHLQSIVQRMDKIYLSAKYKDLKYTVCPEGFQYQPGAGGGCFKVLFQKLNWAKAVDECKTLQPGAHLTAITSAEKQEAIGKFLDTELDKPGGANCTDSVWLGPTGTVWISAQRQNPGRCDPFVWKPVPSVEIPFTYTNWLQIDRQPDCRDQIEECVQIFRTQSYTWNDVNCETQICSLCEI